MYGEQFRTITQIFLKINALKFVRGESEQLYLIFFFLLNKKQMKQFTAKNKKLF